MTTAGQSIPNPREVSSAPTATVHPGTVLVVWDHGGLQLRDDLGEILYVSLYDYRFDIFDGAGHVAIVRLRSLNGEPAVDLTLTDNARLAASHLERRARMRRLVAGHARPAQFVKSESRDTLKYRVEGSDLAMEFEWSGLGRPIFMTGLHPQQADIDVFGQVREASQFRAAVNGRVVPGSAFSNEVYTPWLGRPLHSAAVTIGEVLIAREGSDPVALWTQGHRR